MKREELRTIFPEATDEQIGKVMELNGADIERAKGKATALEAEKKEVQEALDALKTDFEALKGANASAEDYKAKFDALQNEIAEKAKQAEKEKAEQERETRMKARFDAVVGEKKFAHDAIRGHYFRKFEEEIAKDENAGKSDGDIFHALTKDDAGAFEGVKATKLQGGKPDALHPSPDDAKIRAIMGLKPEE